MYNLLSVLYLLGYDIGTSSIKASLIRADSGKLIAQDYYPKIELNIISSKEGWAEQDPEIWWECLVKVTRKLLNEARVTKEEIKAIGISYQMHGLVLVDQNLKVLRPAIIWCDSRAVSIGEKAFEEIGKEKCLSHLLNSPGNFTASKIKWVKDNEPEIFSKVYKAMLPGDFIAMKLTGNAFTTVSGLSEGILWDFKYDKPATFLLDYYEIPQTILPEIVPTFSHQGNLTSEAANELGLSESTIVSYRAGDQPNNAFCLTVMHQGEVAATAGTSGVIYGVTEKLTYDEKSRVNIFAHVNHSYQHKSLGILLCTNGSGIMYSWLKNTLLANVQDLSYPSMNQLAQEAPIGADGLQIFPFGNGAERILENRDIKAFIHNISFNKHQLSHFLRAAQEGVVFSLNYGLNIMKQMGVKCETIKVSEGNLFLSPIFREAFANTTGCTIKLYATSGSEGAARGAGIGMGYYKSFQEAFDGIQPKAEIIPNENLRELYLDTYQRWENTLKKIMY